MKRFSASIIFIALLVVGIVYVSSAVRPNEDRDGVWFTYHRLDHDSIDVLLTGSSKIHANVNPVVMWKNNGFTSYDISGSCMDLTTMYWYLREAFKSQHPKVVVIDVLLFGSSETTLDDIQMRNIMDMPFSINKFSASISGNIEPTNREKVLFPAEQFHSRVFTSQEITSTNYLGKTFENEADNVYMGYRYLGTSKKLNPGNSIQPFDSVLFDRHYKELKLSLDFLKTQNCKVLLVDTPSAYLKNLTLYETAIEGRIGKHYPNVDYLWPEDYQDSLKIDYQTEMLDTSHLNAKGAERFSALIGAYLKNKYEQELSKSVTTDGTSSLFNADYERYLLNKSKLEKGE